MTSDISGTVTFEVKVAEVTTFDKFSKIVKIGNIPWKLNAYWKTAESVEYLAIYTYCNDQKISNLWSCNAQVEIHLMKGNEKQNTRKDTKCFDSKRTSWGFRKFIKKENLLLPENGYVQNDQIILVADIEIKSTVGIRKIRRTDFSTPQNLDSEIILVVDDHKLYVDKYTLISNSPVFRAMFCSDFREKDEKEIKIQDVNYENFVMFLIILHKKFQNITDRNVEGLLELADKYDVQYLIDDCEDYLIDDSEISDGDKLRLSELYSFSNLQDITLKELTSISNVVTAKKEISDIGIKTAKALLDRIDSLNI